jgi:hypothetical protein
MRINEHVEPLVREALDAAVKREGDRLDAALDAFSDESQRRTGLELVHAIARYVLLDLYQGQHPSHEQVQALADKIAEMESWSTLPADEIRSFLLLLLGDTERTVDPDAAVLLSFVVAAALLSSRRRPEGQWWFNYLDQVEAALETQPAT